MPVSRPLVLSGSGFPPKSVTRKAKISDNKLSRKCCVVYDFDSFQVSQEREYDRLVVPIAVNSVWKNEWKNWGENWGASGGTFHCEGGGT